MNIEKIVIDAITSVMNLDDTHNKLNRNTLLSDIYVDEIDIVEIAMYIDEDCRCRIDIMEEMMDIKPEKLLKLTIGELVDMTEEKI